MEVLAGALIVIIGGYLTISFLQSFFSLLKKKELKSDSIVHTTPRKSKKEMRIEYIKGYVLPSDIKDKVCERYFGLTDENYREGEEALKSFFIAHLYAKERYLVMPSKIADSIWHEFILHTDKYTRFCNSAFGEYLHHYASDRSSVNIERQELGLLLTWEISNKFFDNGNERNPLFQIDKKAGLERSICIETINRLKKRYPNIYPNHSSSTPNDRFDGAAYLALLQMDALVHYSEQKKTRDDSGTNGVFIIDGGSSNAYSAHTKGGEVQVGESSHYSDGHSGTSDTISDSSCGASCGGGCGGGGD